MGNWGECFGYRNIPCTNCGRYRVELYENGKSVCEKCGWCIEDEVCIDRESMYELEDWNLKT